MAVSIFPLVRRAEQPTPEQTVVVFAPSLSPTTLVQPFMVRAEPATIFGIVTALAESTRKSPAALMPLLFVQFARAYGIEVVVQHDSDSVDVVIRLWSPEGHGVLGFNRRGECVVLCDRSGSASHDGLEAIEKTRLFEQARNKAAEWLSL
jgi:hypothetical protein